MPRTKQRYKVADTEEISDPGSRVIREVRGTEIAVFNVENEYYAVANYCMHQGAPLCEGELSGDIQPGDDGWQWDYCDENKFITCPWHSWIFDVTTGKNTRDDRYGVPTYEVEVEDGEIFVLR